MMKFSIMLKLEELEEICNGNMSSFRYNLDEDFGVIFFAWEYLMLHGETCPRSWEKWGDVLGFLTAEVSCHYEINRLTL